MAVLAEPPPHNTVGNTVALKSYQDKSAACGRESNSLAQPSLSHAVLGVPPREKPLFAELLRSWQVAIVEAAVT